MDDIKHKAGQKKHQETWPPPFSHTADLCASIIASVLGGVRSSHHCFCAWPVRVPPSKAHIILLMLPKTVYAPLFFVWAEDTLESRLVWKLRAVKSPVSELEYFRCQRFYGNHDKTNLFPWPRWILSAFLISPSGQVEILFSIFLSLSFLS